MKPLTVAGILLAVVGAFVMFRGLTYGSQRNVLRVGDVHISADERHAVPAWAGGVAIVVGVLLVGAGLGTRRGA